MDQHWGISNVVGPAQIAKYLLDEIETVGMLSLVDDLTPREAVGVQLGQYTKDRLLPIGTVLFTVEQEVRIGEGRDFPYMYTAGIWPPEEPLVGLYLNQDCSLCRDRVIQNELLATLWQPQHRILLGTLARAKTFPVE